MSYKKGWFFLMIAASAFACSRTDKAPDVSDIEVNLQIHRFEQALFALDTNDLAAGLARLEAEYPDFSAIFFGQILGSTDSLIAPQGHVAYMKGFLQFPPARRLYDTTQVLYADFSKIEQQFRQAFQLLKYYFPEQPSPDVTTFISEYSVAAFIYGEDQLAVGLDLFLGEDYPYLQYNSGNANFSAYLTRTFNREHLVAKTLQPLVNDLIGPPPGSRLLDLMVHNGKELYLLDKLLPYAPDSVKWEMTPQQIAWLQGNEFEMWAFFLKENLLYSSEWQNIRKYVEYSPNSPGMPPEAPGRTANWLGLQIVNAYMQRYPDTTLRQLIALRDAQQLLDAAKYRPRR